MSRRSLSEEMFPTTPEPWRTHWRDWLWCGVIFGTVICGMLYELSGKRHTSLLYTSVTGIIAVAAYALGSVASLLLKGLKMARRGTER